MYECVLPRRTASERADKGSRREEEDLHQVVSDQKQGLSNHIRWLLRLLSLYRSLRSGRAEPAPKKQAYIGEGEEPAAQNVLLFERPAAAHTPARV